MNRNKASRLILERDRSIRLSVEFMYLDNPRAPAHQTPISMRDFFEEHYKYPQVFQ